MLAIGKLLYCPDIRVAAFAAILRHSRLNTVSDTLGSLAAYTLLDAALVDSIAVLSKEARQPRERRIFFVGLLTRYSDCWTSADTRAIDRPQATVLGGNLHGCGSDDRQVLPLADRERAWAAIDWMAHHDPDERLRAFAAQVSEELTMNWELETRSRPR